MSPLLGGRDNTERENGAVPELEPLLLQAALVIGHMVLLHMGGGWVEFFISLVLFAPVLS